VSTQLSQLPHALGQAAETPSRAHRFAVSLFSTQTQLLVILLPVEVTILSLNEESAHGKLGAFVGDVVGPIVGPTGAAEGLGDGLIDKDGC
jgi:primosomal protein N''